MEIQKKCKDSNHKINYNGREVTVKEWELDQTKSESLGEWNLCCALCYPARAEFSNNKYMQRGVISINHT